MILAQSEFTNNWLTPPQHIILMPFVNQRVCLFISMNNKEEEDGFIIRILWVQELEEQDCAVYFVEFVLYRR